MKNKKIPSFVGFLALFLLVLVAGDSLAQEAGFHGLAAAMGTAFTYQGRLVKSGTLVNDTCDFRFSLWDAQSGGSQVGSTLDKSGVSVTDGYFTVQLDFGSGAFTGDARWLQIEVKCTGETAYTDMGLQPITPAPYALALPGLWTQQNDTSPNLIGGYSGNSVTAGVVGATISGGGASSALNQVSASYAVVGGGKGNTAGGWYATVGGGEQNTASGDSATVSGGLGNEASYDYATVSGGEHNTADSDSSTVCGGHGNHAGNDGNDGATVGGGGRNTASGDYATVSGGLGNIASGYKATVGGGANNTAGGWYATVGGGRSNQASGAGATVGGGGYDGTNTDGNQALAGASTIGGGLGNVITTTASYATVGGGWRNNASGSRATIAGGEENTASGYLTTIGGGFNNQVTGDRSVVAGGVSNTASGTWAAIPGGSGNVAAGNYSFAAGRRAKANASGCFVWADSNDAEINCNTANRTIFRSTGGFYIYTAISPSAGAYLPAGSGSWTSFSDRNAKENFRLVDSQAVLEKVAQLPITTWNYKAQDDSIRHIGPMAQDFSAAFGVGEDDKHISTVDADGVALAAIQGLYQRSQEQAVRIAQLEEENAELRAQVDDLAARVEALEQGRSTSPARSALLPGAGTLLLGILGFVWLNRKGG